MTDYAIHFAAFSVALLLAFILWGRVVQATEKDSANGKVVRTGGCILIMPFIVAWCVIVVAALLALAYRVFAHVAGL